MSTNWNEDTVKVLANYCEEYAVTHVIITLLNKAYNKTNGDKVEFEIKENF